MKSKPETTRTVRSYHWRNKWDTDYRESRERKSLCNAAKAKQKSRETQDQNHPFDLTPSFLFRVFQAFDWRMHLIPSWGITMHTIACKRINMNNLEVIWYSACKKTKSLTVRGNPKYHKRLPASRPWFRWPVSSDYSTSPVVVWASCMCACSKHLKLHSWRISRRLSSRPITSSANLTTRQTS